MWRGEVPYEFSYGSENVHNFVHQVDEENFNLCSDDMGLHVVNDLQPFTTEPSLNYFPNQILNGQTPNDSSQVMETSYRLHNNIISSHELYGVCDLGHAGNVYTNIQPQIQGGVDIGENNGMNVPFWRSTAMKRKAEEDYSSFYAGAKRQITDEHMAAGMNSLCITNDHNYCSNVAMFNPDNDLNMQFSAISDQMQNNDDEPGESKEHPVFHFVAPVEEMLKKQNDILPSEILQEICKPCLAVVPWSPPLHSDSQISKENRRKKIEKAAFTSDEMEDDNFIS